MGRCCPVRGGPAPSAAAPPEGDHRFDNDIAVSDGQAEADSPACGDAGRARSCRTGDAESAGDSATIDRRTDGSVSVTSGEPYALEITRVAGGPTLARAYHGDGRSRAVTFRTQDPATSTDDRGRLDRPEQLLLTHGVQADELGEREHRRWQGHEPRGLGRAPAAWTTSRRPTGRCTPVAADQATEDVEVERVDCDGPCRTTAIHVGEAGATTAMVRLARTRSSPSAQVRMLTNRSSCRRLRHPRRARRCGPRTPDDRVAGVPVGTGLGVQP